MQRAFLKQQGMTLIETLAVVIISTIILMIAISILTKSTSVHMKQTNKQYRSINGSKVCFKTNHERHENVY